MWAQPRRLATPGPGFKDIYHQIGRTEQPHLERTRIRTDNVGKSVGAELESADRIRPGNDWGNFRRSIGIDRGVPRGRNQIARLLREDAYHEPGLTHGDAARSRWND